MIRSILKASVCGLITYAHTRAIVDEVNKPKEKRNKVQIAVSSVVATVGVLAVVGHVASALEK
uniref:Uncharacterized protein n=1 Tax=Pseudomonas phage RVTF4 TaxID=3236931 RepID=A0AB39CD04_9VIRU